MLNIDCVEDSEADSGEHETDKTKKEHGFKFLTQLSPFKKPYTL